MSCLYVRRLDLHWELIPLPKGYEGGEPRWRRKRSVRVKERTSRLILKGPFKGNRPDTEKKGKCAITGNLACLQGLWQMSFTHAHTQTCTHNWFLKVKERLLTCNPRQFPVEDRKSNRSRRQKYHRDALFFFFLCFAGQHHYRPFVCVCCALWEL